MPQPFFSIITCTKNSEKYLDKNISSVSKQSFGDYEHLFIDGRSTDATLQLIRRYRQKCSSQVKLFSAPPSGISSAMNLGITHASGRYLLFLHSDDELNDRLVLDNTHKFLNKNTCLDWIYGQIRTIDSQGNSIGIFPRHWFFQGGYSWLIKYINYIPHQAVFMKPEVFRRYGNFDPELSSKMDLDLWLRIAPFTRFKYFPLLISKFRVHSDAQSSAKVRFTENRRNQIKVSRRYLTFWEYLIFYFADRLVSLKTNLK